MVNTVNYKGYVLKQGEDGLFMWRIYDKSDNLISTFATLELAKKECDDMTKDSQTSDAKPGVLMHLEEAQRAKVKDAGDVSYKGFVIKYDTSSDWYDLYHNNEYEDGGFDSLEEAKAYIDKHYSHVKDSSPTIFKDGMERMKVGNDKEFVAAFMGERIYKEGVMYAVDFNGEHMEEANLEDLKTRMKNY